MEPLQALARRERRRTSEILAQEGGEQRARAERVEGEYDGAAQHNGK